jgi:hypothetical protein
MIPDLHKKKIGTDCNLYFVAVAEKVVVAVTGKVVVAVIRVVYHSGCLRLMVC